MWIIWTKTAKLVCFTRQGRVSCRCVSFWWTGVVNLIWWIVTRRQLCTSLRLTSTMPWWSILTVWRRRQRTRRLNSRSMSGRGSCRLVLKIRQNKKRRRKRSREENTYLFILLRMGSLVRWRERIWSSLSTLTSRTLNSMNISCVLKNWKTWMPETRRRRTFWRRPPG